jgi:DNA-directed RNA polymerase subunit RPC12/RpoP
MDDITFDCPRCKQSLEAPDDMLGQQVDCPACGHKVVIPSPASARVQRATPSAAGNRLHLIGSPTILVILLALALPFLSVSCSNQKFISSSGYKLLANISLDSAKYSESFPTEHGNACFVATIAIVAIAGVMTTVSCILLAFRRNRNLLRINIALSVIGILESTLKSPQSRI